MAIVDKNFAIELVFSIEEDRGFDTDALDKAMAAKGWDCESQSDHSSFARLFLAHGDLNLAAIESQTFARHLETYMKQAGDDA